MVPHQEDLQTSVLLFRSEKVVQKSPQRLLFSSSRSLVQRRDTEVAWIRAQLEQRFAVHPVIYEVVRTTYNPIERWKYGTVIELESIATFHSQYTNE